MSTPSYHSHDNDNLLDSELITLIQICADGKKAASATSSLPPFGQLAEHLYCGSIGYLRLPMVKNDHIDLIINCAGTEMSANGIETVNIPSPNAPRLIEANFSFVFNTLEECSKTGKRAALVCVSGVNKAGALAAAYLMWWRKSRILSTLSLMSDRLGPVLSVPKFRQEVVQFALANRLIEPMGDDRQVFYPMPRVAPCGNVWEDPHPVLFQDDADYERTKPALNPQQRAEDQYRTRALAAGGTSLKPEPSDCASDGESLL